MDATGHPRVATPAEPGIAIVTLEFDADVQPATLAGAPNAFRVALMTGAPAAQYEIGVMNRRLVLPSTHPTGDTCMIVHLLLVAHAEPPMDGMDCAGHAMRAFEELTQSLPSMRGGASLPALPLLAGDLRSRCLAWL